MSIRSERRELDRLLASTDQWVRQALRRVPVPDVSTLTPAQAEQAINKYIADLRVVVRAARSELDTANQRAAQTGMRATARLAEEDLFWRRSRR